MPEALAVLAILVVAIAAWLGASMQARNPANHNAQEEITQLRQHEAWLQQRVELAEREKWGQHMMAALADELAVTSQQLRTAIERTGG